MTRSGDQIGGRYTLRRILGEGGFGVVWLAQDESTARTVAVKILKLETDDARRRFEREAEALERLSHPGCVRPLEFGTHAQEHYLVTEFVDGPSLTEWSASGSVGMVPELVAKIADIVATAHRAGIVHRDLKPGNILITPSDRGPMPHVLDFGIAKLVGRQELDVTQTGEVIGTPGFMSPEQLHGRRDIGPPTDVYSLGILLFTLLEGRPPFTSDTALGLCMAQLTKPAPPLSPSHTENLRVLTAAMLSSDPAARPTMAAVANTLRGREGSAPEAVESEPTTRVPWAAIAVTGLIGIAVALAASLHAPEPTPVRASSAREVSSLLKSDGPEAVAPTEEAEGTAEVARDSAVAEGCEGLELLRGTEKFGRSVVRAPSTYDLSRRHPVVVMFHEAYFTPEKEIQSLDFRSVPDDYVVIAPEGTINKRTRQWRDRPEVDDAIRQINEVLPQLCVRSDSLLVIGHGAGGRVAEAFACEDKRVAALAAFAHRGSRTDRSCTPMRPYHYLALHAENDAVAPANGGQGCGGGDYMSIDEHISRLRSRHRCKEEPQSVRGPCTTWQCNGLLTSCALPGGRMWPNGQPPTHEAQILSLAKCQNITESSDAVTKRIWDFFAEVGPDAAGKTQ